MSLNERLSIIAGSDKSPLIRIRNLKNGDPVDLTNATGIQVKFTKRDRSELVLTNSTIPAVKAQAEYESIIFTAVEDGIIGNGIILNFNNVDDINTVVGAWNTANPTNTVGFTGDGLLVLPSSVVQLSGGINAYMPSEIVDDPKLGRIKVTITESQTQQLRRGKGQNFLIIIDFGQNPSGNRIKGIYSNLDVIDP